MTDSNSTGGNGAHPGDVLVDFVSRPAFVWSFIVLGWVVLVGASPSADPDLFARVAVGRLVEVSGSVVDQDPFAFSPLRDRWIDHEWLSGVVFYRLSQLGGDAALFLFSTVTLAATAALLVRAQIEYGGATSLGWSALTLIHVFGVWVSVVRSRVFTILFVTLLLLVLIRWRSGRSGWLWLLPPLFVPWANLHGGFVAGLGLLGAAAVGTAVESPRRSVALWLCLVACVAATLVNPYGLDYWSYVLEATTMERELISEWQPMRYWQIALASVVLSLFGIGAWLRRKRDRVAPYVLALVGAGLYAAMDAQRLLNFLLLVLAVFGVREFRAVIRGVPSVLPGTSGRALKHVLAGGVVLGAVSLFVVALIQTTETLREGLSYDRYPVEAIEWLDRRGAGGKVLTHFNDGSFALWRLYPAYRVAIDGRYEETYLDETMHLASRALRPSAQGHERALARLSPDYIVLPLGSNATAEDFGEPWRVAYDDAETVVLARPGLPILDEPRPSRPMWEPGF